MNSLLRRRARKLRLAADAARDAGQWREAASGYSAYLARWPNKRDAMIWIQLGNTLKEALRYDEALVAYRQAIDLAPESTAVSAEAHLQLGHLYKRMSAPGKSWAAYLRALQQDPLSAAAQELSGMLPSSETTTRSSRTTLVEADHARTHKQWLRAATLYKDHLAVPGHAEDAAIWVQLGHMHKEAGFHDKAFENYQQAIRLEPNVADTYLQLGHLFKIVGARVQAAASYSQALQLDASLEAARQELAALGVQAESCAGVVPQILDLEQIFDNGIFPLHQHVLSRTFHDRPFYSSKSNWWPSQQDSYGNPNLSPTP